MKTKKLPKVFKAKWITALRSNEFKQGDCQLYNKNNDTYCCLGVACHIAGHEESLKMYGGSSYITAFSAKNVPAILNKDADDYIVCRLSEMNDGTGQYSKKPKSFKQIANWREKNL